MYCLWGTAFCVSTGESFKMGNYKGRLVQIVKKGEAKHSGEK